MYIRKESGKTLVLLLKDDELQFVVKADNGFKFVVLKEYADYQPISSQGTPEGQI